MKLLLVLGSDDNYGIIGETILPLGFEFIRYRHALKAMDNIDEIDPAAIIISARDFPRHWKILVQFVRSERSKEACPIIILKGESFSTEETSKAFFLGVSGVISDKLENPEELNRLKQILSRCAPEQEGPKQRQFFVEPWHRIGLLVANLSGRSIVAADVKTISATGLSFAPAHPLPLKPVRLHRELRECSLRIGDAILSPVCRVAGTGKIISLEFVSFPVNQRHILDKYLEGFHAQESA